MLKNIDRFANVIKEYNESDPKSGIGTLNERCLHHIIKNFYDKDPSHHEIKICGCIADIMRDKEIIEIQTTNFSSLNSKLEKYFADGYNVTVVYPISHIKHIVWLDPETGEILARNKSPKRGTGLSFLYEASKIKKHLTHPNLRFEILLIDMDEYKLKNGWDKTGKRGSIRVDRKPLALFDIITIENPYDVKKILPPELSSDSFDFKTFAKATKLMPKTARYSLSSLIAFEIVSRIGKDRNRILYKLN